MRTLLAIGFLIMAATLTRADDATDAAKKLEGTYRVTGGSFAGKKDDEKLKEITSVIIKDGVISVKTANRDDDAKYTVDPSKKPAEMNLTTVKGNSSLMGIYEAKDTPEGLQLSIAFSHDGGARPKDFKGDGMESVVLVLLRKSEKK